MTSHACCGLAMSENNLELSHELCHISTCNINNTTRNACWISTTLSMTNESNDFFSSFVCTCYCTISFNGKFVIRGDKKLEKTTHCYFSPYDQFQLLAPVIFD